MDLGRSEIASRILHGNVALHAASFRADVLGISYGYALLCFLLETCTLRLFFLSSFFRGWMEFAGWMQWYWESARNALPMGFWLLMDVDGGCSVSGQHKVKHDFALSTSLYLASQQNQAVNGDTFHSSRERSLQWISDSQ